MSERRDVLARALEELRRLKSERAALHSPIAIVGLDGRFPGADSPEALWQLLVDGRDLTSDPPAGRWPEAPPDDPPGMYTRRGGYLRRVDTFDAPFFGVGEREARSLDPQQRLLLEISWTALEHAGIAPDSLRGSACGVFFGVSVSDYAQLLGRVPSDQVEGYFASGVALNFAAGRVAWFLGVHGPSLVLDTACSSSLAAVHQACQSLRAGECSLALAGGVNLILSPTGHHVLCKTRALSPEGRCKTFDAAADGYARGEGAGVVVLERLADARAAGHRVLAVIRGSAINHDGPSSGLTVPSGTAQAAVIRAALDDAGVEPHQIAYVETHGTGTSLGDPIEVRALADALGPGRRQPLLIGAVKTNIGHLESAAGIAGLIKLVLSMGHRSLPATLHQTRPNPAIDWARLPVEVVGALRPWPEGRLAGVSSFGASGTNVHVIVEATNTDSIEPRSSGPRTEILVLHARTEAALRRLVQAWITQLRADPDDLPDRIHTALVGRARLPCMVAVVGSSADALADALASAEPIRLPRLAPSVVFEAGGPPPPAAIEALRDFPAFANAEPSQALETLWKSLGVVPSDDPEGLRLILGVGQGDALATLRRGADARTSLLQTVARLLAHGVRIDLAALHAGEAHRRVDIPTYPFERSSHWLSVRSTLLGARVQGPGLVFETTLHPDGHPLLRDHRVYGHVLVSGAVHGALVQAATRALPEPVPRYATEDIEFVAPLLLGEGPTRVQTRLLPGPDGTASFELVRLDGETTTVISRGHLRPMTDERPEPLDLAAVRERCIDHFDGTDFYERFWRAGEHELGPAFRSIDAIWRRDGEALARLVRPTLPGTLDPEFALTAALSEVHGQVLMPAIPDFSHEFLADDHTYLGQAMERSLDHGGIYRHAAWAHATLTSFTDGMLVGNTSILDADGRVLSCVHGLHARRIPRELVERMLVAAKPRGGTRTPPRITDSAQALDVLRAHLGTLLGEIVELHPRDTLAELGVDSLMAMDLHEVLDTEHGLDLRLDGETSIEALTTAMAGSGPIEPSGAPSRPEPGYGPWFMPLGGSSRASGSRMRLVCLPHGGAGATAFHPWRDRLPQGIECLTVQLPGRWGRNAEPPITALPQLVEALADVLPTDAPFALFGASIGGLFAFELVRALRARTAPLPQHLFVAAYPAPHLPHHALAETATILAELGDDSEHAAAFLRQRGMVPEALLRPDTLPLVLPALRGDLQLARDYRYLEQPPLPVPITVFGGHDDPEVERKALTPWIDHTSSEFAFVPIPGEHLFYQSHPIPVLAAIARALALGAPRDRPHGSNA